MTHLNFDIQLFADDWVKNGELWNYDEKYTIAGATSVTGTDSSVQIETSDISAVTLSGWDKPYEVTVTISGITYPVSPLGKLIDPNIAGLITMRDKNKIDMLPYLYLSKTTAESEYRKKEDIIPVNKGGTGQTNLLNVLVGGAYADKNGALIHETYAPLASPTFTGEPAAPTPETTDNSTKIATTAYVTAKISSIDLSGLDLSSKVDAVEGKGLSTNDYTTDEKNKLAGIAAGAQINVIETVKVNDTALAISDKTVNIDISGKVDAVEGKGLSTNDYTDAEKTKLAGIAAGAQVNTVTGVKGSSETTYRTGNIEISKSNIGLGSVDNTADSAKSVAKAAQLTTARNISVTDGTNTGTASSFNGTADISIKLPATIKATIDGAATSATKDNKGNVITDTYLTKTAAGTTYLGISATAAAATKDSAGNTISTYYAPLASPAFTGSPTSTTPAKNDSSTKVATTAYVDRAITDLVGGAPEALDTLKEIADALDNNASLASTLTTEISGKQPKHAALTSISGLTTAKDQMIYTTAANTYSTTSVTSAARTLLSKASAADIRTYIGAIDSTATVAKATADASGNTITSTYATKTNAISSLSINGKVITWTKADGTTGTLTTQDTVTTNTDQSVKQTNSTANSAYPILLKNGTGTGEVTSSALFNSGITINPSTSTITATNFAGTATKATQDGSGNTITTTYLTKTDAGNTYAAKTAAISSLTISGKTITWTKADGTTGTLTTQDTVTTNTDQSVQQANTTANTAYPILLKNGTGTGTVTTSTLFNSGITVNPSTSTITATNFAGNAATATIPQGFASKPTSATWGNQSGTFITDWHSTKGGDICFRETSTNNTDGRINMIIDGFFYQNEGENLVLDQSNYTTVTVTKTGTGASGSWPISVTGTAANVTGTVAIANGGTGATTEANARKALFSTAMNTAALAKYVITINDNWASGGYTTVQQLRNFMGLGDTTGALPVANGGTGQTSLANVTGVGSALQVNKTVTGTGVADLLYATIADNDYFRLRVGGTATNAGYVELATADDANEPIYVRQYSGTFATLTRTATILDASGNTSFPGTVTASAFSGNATSATKATQDESGNNIKATYVKSVSLSGSTVTVTKGNDTTSTFSVSTSDINVQQTNSTANTAYPILLKNGTGTNTVTTTTFFNSGITVNPSTSTITATNFAGTATKATQDGSGNVITSTYATKATTVTGVAISNGILSKTINGTTTYVPITIPYGTSTETAIAKTVAVANFTLATGSRITVKFTGAGVAGNCTLNVNGTGAKAIYYRGYQVPGDALQANTTLDLVYNGTQWDIVGSFFWVS